MSNSEYRIQNSLFAILLRLVGFRCPASSFDFVRAMHCDIDRRRRMGHPRSSAVS